MSPWITAWRFWYFLKSISTTSLDFGFHIWEIKRLNSGQFSNFAVEWNYQEGLGNAEWITRFHLQSFWFRCVTLFLMSEWPGDADETVLAQMVCDSNFWQLGISIKRRALTLSRIEGPKDMDRHFCYISRREIQAKGKTNHKIYKNTYIICVYIIWVMNCGVFCFCSSSFSKMNMYYFSSTVSPNQREYFY